MESKIHNAVSSLREVCGFRNSESATESFLDLLAVAVKRAKRERMQSHHQGLCLDCQAALSCILTEILRDDPIKNGESRSTQCAHCNSIAG